MMCMNEYILMDRVLHLFIRYLKETKGTEYKKKVFVGVFFILFFNKLLK